MNKKKVFEKFLKRAWFVSVALVALIFLGVLLFDISIRNKFVPFSYKNTPESHVWFRGLLLVGTVLSFGIGMLSVVLWKDNRRYRLQKLLYAITPPMFVWTTFLAESRFSFYVLGLFVCMGAVCLGMALMDKVQARKMDVLSLWQVTNTLFFMLFWALLSLVVLVPSTGGFCNVLFIVGAPGGLMLPISILMMIFQGRRFIFRQRWTLYVCNGLLFVPLAVCWIFSVTPLSILVRILAILGAILLPLSAVVAVVSLRKRWRPG